MADRGKRISHNDVTFANWTLACGLLSVVPLLNLATIPLGIVFGIVAVRYATTRPGRYGGLKRSIVGLTICVVWLLMTIYAMIVYGPAALLKR